MRNLRPLARSLLFIISSAVVLAFVAPFARKFTGKESEVFLGVVTSIVTFGLTVLFVRWEGLRLADVGARVHAGSAARLALGLLVGSTIIATWALILVAIGQMHWVRASPVDARSILVALMAYLSLACREELTFRGYPLRRLHGSLGLWGAQILIALIFAFEHKLAGATWVDAFLGSGVGSLLFGMVAMATRGLAMPIGVHAAWNLGHWALGLKGTPGVWSAVIDEHQHGASLTAIVLYDVVMLSATVVFYLWYRRRQHTDRSVS